MFATSLSENMVKKESEIIYTSRVSQHNHYLSLALTSTNYSESVLQFGVTQKKSIKNNDIYSGSAADVNCTVQVPSVAFMG